VLPAARAALEAVGVTDVRLTTRPGDEERLAREAAMAGVETIIALGGDGTWGNAARGILESGRDARLVLMAAGTGNDFAHAAGVPAGDYQAMARIAASTGSRRIDLGCVNGVAFLNVAAVGITAGVLERMPASSVLSGPLVYFATALPVLRRFDAFPAGICREDGPPDPDAAFLAIIASNGSRLGGGFRVAPYADPGDGWLNLVTVRDAPLGRRLSLFTRARFGAHLGQPEVAHERIRRCVLSLREAAPLLDVDGELRRAGSPVVEFTCLPAALRIGAG
jgi:YegS/Rv2252/BmrU family lipid kinase